MTNTQSTPLHLAAFSGHLDTVRVLLSHGAAVDPQRHRGASPLHLASQEGHLTTVVSLLQAGASVSLPDTDGVRPIHLAAQCDRVAVVGTLLDHGCSIEQVSASVPSSTHPTITGWQWWQDSSDVRRPGRK